jgi:hypothetical protein
MARPSYSGVSTTRSGRPSRWPRCCASRRPGTTRPRPPCRLVTRSAKLRTLSGTTAVHRCVRPSRREPMSNVGWPPWLCCMRMRKLHAAAHVAPAAVGGGDGGVAHHRVRQRRIDARHQAGAVDPHQRGLEAAGLGEADSGVSGRRHSLRTWPPLGALRARPSTRPCGAAQPQIVLTRVSSATGAATLRHHPLAFQAKPGRRARRRWHGLRRCPSGQRPAAGAVRLRLRPNSSRMRRAVEVHLRA